MARYQSANYIINRVAVEVGLLKVPDPVSDADEIMQQLTSLLTACGQELVELFPWQNLVGSYQVITKSADTGNYDLPADFSYMIDQTGWELKNRVAVAGPLSAQDWTYLKGRNLVSSSIYVSFRMLDGYFSVFPNNPVPDGLDINFEYISRNWVVQVNAPPTRADEITKGSDIVLYEPILIIKFLKAKFLESKGFDATSARMEFENMFNSRTGKDTGAAILNAGGMGSAFPYIHPHWNTPDTGYGGP